MVPSCVMPFFFPGVFSWWKYDFDVKLALFARLWRQKWLWHLGINNVQVIPAVTFSIPDRWGVTRELTIPKDYQQNCQGQTFLVFKRCLKTRTRKRSGMEDAIFYSCKLLHLGLWVLFGGSVEKTSKQASYLEGSSHLFSTFVSQSPCFRQGWQNPPE